MENWSQTADAVLDPTAPAIVCNTCRREGAPQARAVGLTIPQHRTLQILATAPSFAVAVREAALENGMSEEHVRDMINGRRSPEMRRAYQLLLESKGVDMDSIASVTAECLDATEQKWNPKEEAFNEFPDHRTRLNTVKYATRTLELEPPKATGAATAVQVNVIHNLPNSEVDPPGTFRATVKEKVIP